MANFVSLSSSVVDPVDVYEAHSAPKYPENSSTNKQNMLASLLLHKGFNGSGTLADAICIQSIELCIQYIPNKEEWLIPLIAVSCREALAVSLIMDRSELLLCDLPRKSAIDHVNISNGTPEAFYCDAKKRSAENRSNRSICCSTLEPSDLAMRNSEPNLSEPSRVPRPKENLPSKHTLKPIGHNSPLSLPRSPVNTTNIRYGLGRLIGDIDTSVKTNGSCHLPLEWTPDDKTDHADGIHDGHGAKKLNSTQKNSVSYFRCLERSLSSPGHLQSKYIQFGLRLSSERSFSFPAFVNDASVPAYAVNIPDSLMAHRGDEASIGRGTEYLPPKGDNFLRLRVDDIHEDHGSTVDLSCPSEQQSLYPGMVAGSQVTQVGYKNVWCDAAVH